MFGKNSARTDHYDYGRLPLKRPKDRFASGVPEVEQDRLRLLQLLPAGHGGQASRHGTAQPSL